MTSLVQTIDTGRDARLARYEREGRPTSIAERRCDLEASTGGSPAATVAALRLAATPPGTEAAFADKVTALRAHVAGLAAPLQAHVAALSEAALAAEISRLVSSGRPFFGRGVGGWLVADHALGRLIPEASPTTSSHFARRHRTSRST